MEALQAGYTEVWAASQNLAYQPGKDQLPITVAGKQWKRAH